MYRVIWVVAFQDTITGYHPIMFQCWASVEYDAMGYNAGPTLNRYWVGRPTMCVPGTSYRSVH